MFYAMATRRIAPGPPVFRHILHDIETLNHKARTGEFDFTAVSVASYPDVAGKYLILRSGASFGDGYGPVLVSRRPMRMEELEGCTVAIPGLKTSAFLALSLAAPKGFVPLVTPFDRILDVVSQGGADAGLIIHEGQLTYSRIGLQRVADLGVWWKEKMGGLPLPLGVNVIRRDIAPHTREYVLRVFSESIAYSLSHRDEAVRYSMNFSRGLSMSDADRFVGLYVNDLTVDMGSRGETAIRLFLEEGRRAGLVGPAEPEFA